jgi:hypothetical protein
LNSSQGCKRPLGGMINHLKDWKMGIGKYIIFSVVFLAAVGFFIINTISGDHTIEMYGHSVTLPIVVWILIPPILLFIASVFHMSAYSVGSFFKKRAIGRDYDTFVNGAIKKILGEKVALKAKTHYFETPMKLLNSLENMPGEKIEIFSDERIQKALNFAKEIRSGVYVDSKEFKLSKESKLFKINQKNKLAVNSDFAYEILRNCADKTSPLCKDAFSIICQNSPFKEIKRYDYPIFKEELMTILQRMDNEQFVLSEEEIYGLLKDANLDQSGFIESAKVIKGKIDPDMLIKLFERLHGSDEAADEAYLYILFDLQMIDRVKEILDNSGEDEYQKIRALTELKEQGKNYDIDMFI